MDMKASLKNATDKVAAALSLNSDPNETDVLSTLKKEHDEVQELMRRMVDSKNAAERKSLVKQVKAALVPHSKAEEAVVYDSVIAVKGENNQVDGAEGYIEHALASATLLKLDGITPATGPEFTATAKVLKELLDHHIQEEERNIWADVKSAFDPETRLAMNRRYLAAKKTIKIS